MPCVYLPGPAPAVTVANSYHPYTQITWRQRPFRHQHRDKTQFQTVSPGKYYVLLDKCSMHIKRR